MNRRDADGAEVAAAGLLARAGGPARRAAPALDTLLSLGPGPVRRARGRASRRDARAWRDAVYRRLWSQAAAALGAEVQFSPHGFADLSRAGRSVRVRHQTTPLDDPVALAFALDKRLVHGHLAAAGVPVPEHVPFDAGDPSPALALLERAGRCVVKPASGTAGGEGVTAGIRFPADLRRACLHAARYSRALLAEAQAPGPVHRVLLLDGEVLDVIVDRPPHVTGDGRSTIEALIAAEDERRLAAEGAAGLELLELDADLTLALRTAGLGLRSVPEAGRAVAVKAVTNDRGPPDSATYRGTLDASVLAHARAGAAVAGLRLAGIDVVAPVIDRPLGETGGVVLEVNGTPGLHRHAQVADAAGATRVAEPVLERLLAEARP